MLIFASLKKLLEPVEPTYFHHRPYKCLAVTMAIGGTRTAGVFHHQAGRANAAALPSAAYSTEILHLLHFNQSRAETRPFLTVQESKANEQGLLPCWIKLGSFGPGVPTNS